MPRSWTAASTRFATRSSRWRFGRAGRRDGAGRALTARASTAALAHVLDGVAGQPAVCGGDVTDGKMLGIGVVGLGHWVRTTCASSISAPASASLSRPTCPPIAGGTSVSCIATWSSSPTRADVFSRADVDAVVIATPAHTHVPIARAALEAGKHVLLEKPMCTSLADARELLAVALACDRVLMHGHVFVYNAGIRYLHDGIAKGDFGGSNTCTPRAPISGRSATMVSVVEDLATHELTIFDYLFGRSPNWVSATGSRLLGTEHEDVAFVTLQYGESTLAHVHVSWLNPQKVRDDHVGRRSADGGLERHGAARADSRLRQGRHGRGRITILRRVPIAAARRRHHHPEAEYAGAAQGAGRGVSAPLRTGELTPSEGEAGVRVVACLDAIATSLREDGRRVTLAGAAIA